jgi:hypothetical protein
MRFLIPAFAFAVLICPPVFAEEPAAAPVGPSEPQAAAPQAAAPAAVADPGASEARRSKMRGRWTKMTPQQREEMRQKAARRLQERYERLSPQEQAQINTIFAEVGKLNKEQRSVYLAQLHEQEYKQREQKKLMKAQETKPLASSPANPVTPSLAAVPSPLPAKKQ